MKGMWVGYGVGCTMRLTLGHGAWQIDQPNNGSMWNSYSFQPVGQWMGYSFTDLGAEGCCRSLNALFCVELFWRNITILENHISFHTIARNILPPCAKYLYIFVYFCQRMGWWSWKLYWRSYSLTFPNVSYSANGGWAVQHTTYYAWPPKFSIAAFPSLHLRMLCMLCSLYVADLLFA